jgi:hypothetical protein
LTPQVCSTWTIPLLVDPTNLHRSPSRRHLLSSQLPRGPGGTPRASTPALLFTPANCHRLPGSNLGDRKGKSREAASIASEERRSGNACEVEGIPLDAMALDDDGKFLILCDRKLKFVSAPGRSREPSNSHHASRLQSPESERASSRTREPVNSSFAPPVARNSLWSRVNLSPPANTSTPADQARGADAGTRKRTCAASQNPDLGRLTGSRLSIVY